MEIFATFLMLIIFLIILYKFYNIENFATKKERAEIIYEKLKNMKTMPGYSEYKNITDGGDAVEFVDVKKLYYNDNINSTAIESAI